MAQIGNVYQVETTEQSHTGDLTYTTKFTVLGSALEANTEYLFFLTAQIAGQNTVDPYKFRTQIGGVTPEGAEMIVEPAMWMSGGGWHPYIFMHKFTTGATPDDITFQIAPYANTTDTAYADSITFFAIKLDDLTGSDFYYGEDTTDGDHTTGSTWGDEASITFTPDNNGDDWLVVAWGSVHINNITKQWRYRINYDSGTSLEPAMAQEGEDLADEWPWMLVRPYNLDNTSHTFKIQSNDDDAAGDENQHNISKIFALRLNAFENFVTSWDGGTFNTPDANWNELADLAFTPDTTGNAFVIGSAVGKPVLAFKAISLRIQLAGTTEPIGKDAHFDTWPFGIGNQPIPIFAQVGVAASIEVDIDIDCKIDTDVGMDFADRGFAAFSLELAPPPTNIDNVYQAETSSQTHTGDTTYTTKFTVDGSNFTANTEYWMLITAMVGGSSSINRFKFRAQIGGVTPEGAEMLVQPHNNPDDRREAYSFLHKFTTGVTPDDVTFQIAPITSGSDIARADTIVLEAISADDLAAGDFYYGEDTADGDHTTVSTWGDEASITFTPDNNGDIWAIIAWGSVHINNITKQWRYRINYDSGTSLEPLHSLESQGVDDEIPWLLIRPYTLDDTEHTFTVQSNDDSATGVENQHNISKIIALRLNAFENFEVFWNGGTFDTPDTNWNEDTGALAFTPDTTGNALVLGTAVGVINGGGATAARVQLGGVTVLSGMDVHYVNSSNLDDFASVPFQARIAVTASTFADIDIDLRVKHLWDNFVDRGYVAFSLELDPIIASAAGVATVDGVGINTIGIGSTSGVATAGAVGISDVEAVASSVAGLGKGVENLQVTDGDDDLYHVQQSHSFNNSVNILAFGGQTASDSWDIALRFASFPVPGVGSVTIDVAYFTFMSATNSVVASPVMKIQADDVDDSPQIADDSDLHVRFGQLTTAEVAWDNLVEWDLNNKYESIDFAAVIQEIIDRPGWVEGNAINFIIQENSGPSSSWRQAYSKDATLEEQRPVLHLEYTFEAARAEGASEFNAVASAVGSTSKKLDLQVSAGADDAYHFGNHAFSATYTKIYGGADTVKTAEGVMRFTGIIVPPGTIINAAYLSFKAGTSLSGTIVRTNIQAEAEDGPDAVVDDPDWHTRVLTTALIPWDDIPPWTADSWYDSPSIVDVIQELVDREGWNEIVNIFWLDDGSDGSNLAYRNAWSYNANPLWAPKLHIEYDGVSAVGDFDVDEGSDATSVGTSTANGIGESGAEADGSSVGVATTSGTGESNVEADGSSVGVATTSGTGESNVEADGSSVAVAVVSGVGDQAGSVATVAGTSGVNGIGESDTEAVASDSGVAEALGIGKSDIELEGSMVTASSIIGNYNIQRTFQGIITSASSLISSFGIQRTFQGIITSASSLISSFEIQRGFQGIITSTSSLISSFGFLRGFQGILSVVSSFTGGNLLISEALMTAVFTALSTMSGNLWLLFRKPPILTDIKIIQFTDYPSSVKVLNKPKITEKIFVSSPNLTFMTVLNKPKITEKIVVSSPTIIRIDK